MGLDAPDVRRALAALTQLKYKSGHCLGPDLSCEKERRVNLLRTAALMLSAMQYPHWMILGGGILVVMGSIGLVFRQKRKGETVDERTDEAEPEAAGK